MVGRSGGSAEPGVVPLGPPSLVSAEITAKGVIWGHTSPSSIDSGEFEGLDADGTLKQTAASLVLRGFDPSALAMVDW